VSRVHSRTFVALAFLLLMGTGATATSSPSSDDVGRASDRCSLTGGGCLNEEGGTNGRRQSTFGGSLGTRRDADPFEEHTWQHVDRDGRIVLIDFKSQDAHVIRCRPEPRRRCPPRVMDIQIEFEGTGTAKILGSSLPVDANFHAEAVDRDPACGPERDLYSITIRAGHSIGRGEVLFEKSGEIDCGNLQIREPRPGPR
jgi:hypothetical protein